MEWKKNKTTILRRLNTRVSYKAHNLLFKLPVLSPTYQRFLSDFFLCAQLASVSRNTIGTREGQDNVSKNCC